METRKATVRALVVGSDGINEKRREIITVVGTVMGLLQKNFDFEEVVQRWQAEYGARATTCFDVTGARATAHLTPFWDLTIHLSLSASIAFHDLTGQVLYSSSWLNASEGGAILLPNVRWMHKELQPFLDAILTEFPHLEASLERFLMEAEERGVTE